MKGKISINIRSARTMKIVDRREINNLVMDAQKLNVLRSLCSPTSDPGVAWRGGINRMQFGTGSTAESVSDTHLVSPITPIKTVTTQFFSTSVKFTAYLLANEANGFPITEAGLITTEGDLAARKVFSKIDKTADYIVEFEWVISC